MNTKHHTGSGVHGFTVRREEAPSLPARAPTKERPLGSKPEIPEHGRSQRLRICSPSAKVRLASKLGLAPGPLECTRGRIWAWHRKSGTISRPGQLFPTSPTISWKDDFSCSCSCPTKENGLRWDGKERIPTVDGTPVQSYFLNKPQALKP